MGLEINVRTRFAIYLEVRFNGELVADCVGINLETNEGTFLNRGAIAERAPDNREPQYIKLRGEFKLGLLPALASSGLAPEQVINEIHQSVLWHAMTEEERRRRFENPLKVEPSPRDAELKEIFDRMFADYRAGLGDAHVTDKEQTRRAYV